MKPFNEHGKTQTPKVEVGDYLLHGDVIVTAEAQLPENFNEMELIKDECLAYGEVTGHIHKVIGEPGDFEVREDRTTKVRYLKVVRPVALKHQEHLPIILPPGNYRTDIQREYDPFTKRIRQVAD